LKPNTAEMLKEKRRGGEELQKEREKEKEKEERNEK
jgi:hypothetical protein